MRGCNTFFENYRYFVKSKPAFKYLNIASKPDVVNLYKASGYNGLWNTEK